LVQPKVRIPEKDQREVATTVLLLKKRAKTSNLAKKSAIELQLKMVSERIRSLAEAQLLGDSRPILKSQSLGDPAEIAREWAAVLKDFGETETSWAKPGLASEAEFQKGIESYRKALKPLIAAFKSATSSNITGVKSKAQDVIEELSEAEGTLEPLSASSKKARVELEHFCLLVDHLRGDPPDGLEQVNGTRASLHEAVQKVRVTQQAIKDQVTAINNLATKRQAKLESLIKEMVAAAVAWRQSKKVQQGADVFASLVNGTVSAVQALDGEPMSALALQGVHSLIKGVCDGIKVGAAAVQSVRLKQAHDVMSLVDKVKDDDFIQAKLDLLKLGLSWLVEPLGLIPSVGTIVRSAVNIGVGGVVGTLKKAAARQAEEAQRNRGEIAVNVSPEINEAVELIRDSTLEYVKGMLGGAVKAFANPEEGAGELLLEVLGGVLGEPLQALVSRVIGEFDLVDKEQVKKTIQKGQAAVAAQAGELQKMAQINMAFGFDEQAAKALTTKNLEGLDEGQSCAVLVAGSPELTSTRGVALLIGDGHTQDNMSFVTSLVKAGHGYRGTVQMKEKGSALSSGKLAFSFSDKGAEQLVESYIKHYGTSDNRITRKERTYR
jgi:hypothetical protein